MEILNSADEITQDDQVIVVMGQTGSGKSRLIDCLTEKTDWSGDSLKSATQTVRAVRVATPFKGYKPTVLIDTPGFDDTHRSDVEILELIAEWLKNMYANGRMPTGIFYLHRITDNRMTATSNRNLDIFGKVCGNLPAKRVLFVTTMWDNISTKLGEEREAILKTHWKRMENAETGRFKNDHHSAWQCVCRVLTVQEKEQPTLIQEEMVKHGRSVNETQAGRALRHQKGDILCAHRKKLKQLVNDQNNPDVLEEIQRIEKEIGRLEGDVDGLRVSLPRRIQLFFSKKPKGKSLDLAELISDL